MIHNMKAALNIAEMEREELVADKTKELCEEYLNDISRFEGLESGYEFLSKNAGNLQRALRNLDDAIKGKEYAIDAVFTALGYIQTNLRWHCEKEADDEVADAYELYLDSCIETAKDRRIGL